MPKKLSIVLIFLFACCLLNAQRKKIDSLLSSLNTGIDTVDIKNRIKLSEAYRNYNNDTSLQYSRQALDLATKKKYPYWEAIAYNSLGYNFYVNAKYDSAIYVFEQYRKISEQRNDHLNTGSAINNIGNVYIELGNYSKALGYYMQALEQRKIAGEKPDIAASYNNLGYVYKEIGEYDKAIENILISLRIFDEIHNDAGISYSHTFLGTVYALKKDYASALQHHTQALQIEQKINDKNGEAISLQSIASIYAEQKVYDKAIANFNAASQIYISIGDKRQLALVKENVAGIEFKKNNIDSAFSLYKQALSLNKTIGNIRALSSNYNHIAECFLKQNNISAAKPYLDSALKYGTQTSKKEDLKNIYKSLSDYYFAAGNFKEAFNNYKNYEALKDSLFNIENSKAIASMQTKYETEKKEKQIQEQQFDLAKKNYWIAGIASLLILASLLSFSYYRRYKLNQEKKLQTEIIKQQDLATKLVIEAEEKERKRIAGDLHDGVGQMMSAAKMNLSSFESKANFKTEEDRLDFEKIISLVDESCKEVRMVSHNMMPNALLKFGLSSAVKEFIDKIDHHVLKVNLHSEGLNERLDTNIETVLYRVIQECVNNVIKHSNANTLDISLIKDADGIACTIEDNGKGFDASQQLRFEGIGLKNIIARIEYLKGSVDFDSSPGKGTLVAIHVPLK